MFYKVSVETKLPNTPRENTGLSSHVPLVMSFLGGPRCVACRILVPQPDIEPVPLALGAQSLKRWMAREVTMVIFSSTNQYINLVKCASVVKHLI